MYNIISALATFSVNYYGLLVDKVNVTSSIHNPSWYFSSCSNPVEQGKEQGTPEEGSCKKNPRKLKSLAGCYNYYKGNELAYWKIWVATTTRVMSLRSIALNNSEISWVISLVMYLKISLWRYLGWNIYIYIYIYILYIYNSHNIYLYFNMVIHQKSAHSLAKE